MFLFNCSRFDRNLIFTILLLPTMLLTLMSAANAADAIPASPAFTPEQLLETPSRNWVNNGGNVYNQRYSSLDDVNRDNVANLKAEWRTHLRGSGVGPRFSGQAQSLVYEGILYMITGANDVFALNVETGEILWQYTANLDPEQINVCCGWTNRGVAMGDGKIFFGRLILNGLRNLAELQMQKVNLFL